VAHEAAAVTKAWVEVLTANSTLMGIVSNQVFAGIAPIEAVEPYVVGRQRSGGSDEYVFGGQRAFTEPLIDIGIVVKDNQHSDAARNGPSLIDDAVNGLSDYSVTVDGTTYKISALREGGAWIRPEVDDGKKFFWVGGSYRFYVTQA
jgi:hypothetical protein